MMNRDEMLRTYNAHSAADAYVLGFAHHGQLFAIELPELPDAVLKLDHASSKRGGQAKIRVRVAKAEKLALIAMGAAVIGKVEDLEADPHHNRGENFERIVTELNGQRWTKDSVPFWMAGDLSLNGRELQIKFDGAELTNEKTLAGLAVA
jgi:hypothetical protein